MALEELIVAWAKERPPWQREVMRRVAGGEVLSEDEYDKLVADIIMGKEPANSQFGLKELPQPKAEDVPVSLVSIEKTEHVNALESKVPLTFEPKGLTIIYGDNGSGKSGYARLLKRITRSRHREDVLTDVFRDTSLMKPTALLSVRIGDTDVSLAWPDVSPVELKIMLFYDGACGDAYIADESDFPYRPSALYIMDALIEACLAVRTRIEAKLAANAAETQQFPTVPEQARLTDAGKFLVSLSPNSSVEALDLLITQFDQSSETIEQLKDKEARLRAADTTKLRQQLTRQSEKLAALQKHVEHLARVFGPAALAELEQRQDELKALNDTAIILARSFDSEPLQGVGSSAWKDLWEAAQRFSKDHGYPQQSFPFLGDECRCVLCQQPLADRRSRSPRSVRGIRP